ncbi:MAG: hypothetical protein LBL74_01885 [Bacteroidales bacterium]|nr:hypothetical protein [Bacteroidales bacterium]
MKFIMLKKIAILLFMLPLWHCQAQNLSDIELKDALKALDKNIKELSSQNTDNLTLIHIYSYQITAAQTTIEKYKTYKDNSQIREKWLQLKTLAEQNKPVIDFIEQNLSQRFYAKGLNALLNGRKQEAMELFAQSAKVKPDNVMANYQIAKLKLDSGKVKEAMTMLFSTLETGKANEDEANLCNTLLTFAYNKSMVRVLAMMKEGKFADAENILVQLQDACDKDKFGICNMSNLAANIEKCRNGIYDDHLKIAKRAMDMGKTDIAAAFINNTMDYMSRNREDIKNSSSFDNMAEAVIAAYIKDAKNMTAATQNEVRIDKLIKAKNLAEMIGGEIETEALKNIASINGTTSLTDNRLDSIEANTPAQGYSQTYSQYINDTISDSDKSVEQIEKDYIASSNNKLPKRSVAVEQTKAKSMSKEIDDKFYEVRSFITVNNYEKALEVLESANRLAKIDIEKKEVEKMYLAAIREITAKRMSAAEYAVFVGDIAKADSLVALTQELLVMYKMTDDKRIKEIMNAYLLSLDKKVCAKKQEEIDVFVSNIMDCIRRNDFYAANQNIERAIQIKGSSQCRLDKSKVRALKRQIDKPLEYVGLKEQVSEVLNESKDTMKFVFGYAGLEQYYIDNALAQMQVKHEPLRAIMHSWNDDKLVIKSIEYLMKYRKFEIALSLIGTLKDFGYKASDTKKIQSKLGEMMALENMKDADKIERHHRVSDFYQQDKWFKYFNKSYEKSYEKWKKENKISN